MSPGLQLDVNESWLLKRNDLREPLQEEGFVLVPITPKVLGDLRGPGRAIPDLPAVPPGWQSKLQSYDYRVGPGDILAVTVWDHPELTNPARYQTQEGVGQRVSPDGTMFFPYAGTLQVANRTVEEIRQLIAERIVKFINNPQVDVRVIGFRSKRIHVAGAVRQPRELPITDVPLTLVNAINAAGGPTSGEPTPGIVLPEADLENVRVIREGQELQVSLLDIYQRARLDQNIILQDGDVVFVPDKRDKEIFVMGEVNKPGVQYLARGRLSLAAALQLAGGMNQESANSERVYVVRQGAKEPLVYQLNATSPSALLLATRFQLQPHDVVVVSTADVARARRVLIPIVQALQIGFFGSRIDQ